MPGIVKELKIDRQSACLQWRNEYGCDHKGLVGLYKDFNFLLLEKQGGVSEIGSKVPHSSFSLNRFILFPVTNIKMGFRYLAPCRACGKSM